MFAVGGPIFPSLGKAGLAKPEEGLGEAMDPNREGKVSLNGERELGSKVIEECMVREVP